MIQLLVDGIDVPLTVEDYCTPNLEVVCDYYPHYLARCILRGSPGRCFQDYLLTVCRLLERHQARPGRTRDQYLSRFLDHFGIAKLEGYIHGYSISL